MKLRRVKLVLIACGCLLLLGLERLAAPRPFAPCISFLVAGYTNDGYGHIVGNLILTNTGPGAFAYDYVWGTGKTDGGEETYGMDLSTFAVKTILSSQSAKLRLVLPPQSQSWHCLLRVYEPSARLKAETWLISKGLRNPRTWWLIQGLPNKSGVSTNILSPTFDVPAEFRTP